MNRPGSRARLRTRMLAIVAGALLAPLAVADAPTPPPVVADAPDGQDAVVAGMHRFLERRIDAAAASRRAYQASLRGTDGRVDAARARADLREVLGVPAECAAGTPADLLGRDAVATTAAGRIERWTLRVCGELLVIGLVGVPAAAGPAPLIVALHGTNATPERVFGLPDRAAVEGADYHHAFGSRLLARGYAVFAPVLLTETRSDPREGYNRTRNQVNQRALPLGLTANGLQIGMLSGALGRVARELAVPDGRVGVYGISHGGQLAFYLAALDPRITATVVSQWFEPRVAKLVGDGHPGALWLRHDSGHNFFPGMLAKFTDRDVARLVAPRALFIEAGALDRERAGRARAGFAALAAAAREAGTPPGAVCMEIAPGAGHEIVMAGAADFLDAHLRPGSGAPPACPGSPP